MRSMTRLASTVLTMALVLVACTRENPNAPDPALESDLGGEAQQRELETVQSWAAMPDGGIAALAGNTIAAAVHVPAGSVDALQAAIAAAGPNGTVILDAGNHSESNTVLVTHKVAILGEPGAILTSDVDHYGITGFLKPALHVRGADHVKIWGLDMRPADAIGGTAILLEDSDHALVANNEMHAFQYVVMLEQAHQASITANTIVCSPAWQTGDITDALGIVVINGQGTSIAGNDVSQGLFGIWATDRRGWLIANTVHENFIGIILCCVPDEGFTLPGGELVGSALSGTQWKATGNNATGNLDAGYLVIDGANNNLLVANNASNNGTYDIDLTADTYRFGFLTPASFENRVIAAPFANIRIKDCGNDNIISGGIVEPNDAAHPCN